MQGESITGHSRPSATDMLAILSIVRCWMLVSGLATSKSFLALCDFISAIQVAKYDCDDVERQASILDGRFTKWLTLFRLEHGDDNVIPKSH